MPLSIDPRDPLPIYAQLERAIRHAVQAGEWKTGHRLPTVRSLAVELKINANTVAKVYAELEREGLLETRRGVGTFVTDQPAHVAQLPAAQKLEKLAWIVERFAAEAAASGISVRELIDELRKIRSR